MTGPAVAPAPAVTGTPAAPPTTARWAGFRLSWRLIRRGVVLMCLAVAGYLAVELVSFRIAYPDQASRQRLLSLSGSTAVRMLEGVPAGSSAAGLAAWDGGWLLTLILAAWALLSAVRLTRGEEDAGRAELVLCRPPTARRVLAGSLAALAAGLACLAGAVALPFLLLGAPVAGTLLWAGGLWAFGTVPAALGALAGQLLQPRRRATALGLGVVAGLFLVRAVANSAPDRRWLRTATPFGWLDRLHAFAGDRWPWLAAPLALALLLGAAAIGLRGRRDAGAAVWAAPDSRRSRPRLLGGAGAFGWRLGESTLLAWALALGVTSLVFGLMSGAVVGYLRTDATYRRLLASMGVDVSVPVVGFLGYLAVFLALPLAAFLGWRLGAARQEEATGRLDNLLARGVPRRRWLAVTAGQAVGAVTLLLAGCALALWSGVRLAGVPVGAGQVVEPVAGLLPLLVLCAGLATLAFGVVPRLTTALPITLAVLGYLLDTFGGMLRWPAGVLALSPFHHLARLPAAPLTATAALTMTGLGLAGAVAGIAAFGRRDLTGA
ncbi:MAG TPA: hypothetical protein VMB79_03970 [Jatrophihabitans sp.]|nr:hypothetical protein [Jatrophihabitans sp.]